MSSTGSSSCCRSRLEPRQTVGMSVTAKYIRGLEILRKVRESKALDTWLAYLFMLSLFYESFWHFLQKLCAMVYRAKKNSTETAAPGLSGPLLS